MKMSSTAACGLAIYVEANALLLQIELRHPHWILITSWRRWSVISQVTHGKKEL